jgi:hypothetical protein
MFINTATGQVAGGGGALWRPCNFTPIHSLTGPVGQPFAPCLGVSGPRPGDAQTHNGTGFLLLALSRYIGDPDVIDHWPRPGSTLTMGSFTRFCADDVKSQL